MVCVNIHIDADSLIRDNCEPLRFRVEVPPCASSCASLHIQNVIARRQHSTIVPVRVRSNPRDFFLSFHAQDEQRIISVVFRRRRRRVFIAEVDRLGRKDLQVSLHDTRRQSITRCSAAGEHQKDAPTNQVLEEQ